MTQAPELCLPLLSVIIPVRNGREAWHATWESLCKLDPQGDWIEVVVVDGDSTDGTWEDLCAQQQDQREASPREELPLGKAIHGPQLVLLRKPARGIYDAMNHGAAEARGNWWTFLGAGDRVDPEFDWNVWREQARENVIQVFRVDLRPPLEPGVPPSYPARWDRSLWWRHTTHHQGIWYPANLLPNPPYDVNFAVLADYDLHLHLFQSGLPAQCWTWRWAFIEAGGVSRNFVRALYREELRIKWRRLPLFQAVSITPFILFKWLYKKGMRWMQGESGSSTHRFAGGSSDQSS
jgi:putative colanic acid biosynthesis glycosyltransferase